MTRWLAFAGVTLAVLVLLLLLARASQSAVSGPALGREDGGWLEELPDGADHLDVEAAPRPASTPGPSAAGNRRPEFSTAALLVNVAFSHGLFAAVMLAAILLADVPAAALGVEWGTPLSTGARALSVGVALGVALSVANTMAAGLARVFDTDPSEELRDLLAPETAGGWVVLLVGVLPVIAGFEELLFRAALVGAFSVGLGVSPWPLAVLSSVAFAAGHGAQGSLGLVVTGLLGFALAVAFVLTNSLLAVVLAHYLVNAAEFVLVEGLGWRPFRP